jgi:hypothetical protein
MRLIGRHDEEAHLRTRIRALVAGVIPTAAIGGALAAPVAASPPQFQVVATCEVEPGTIIITVTGQAGAAQRGAIKSLNLFLEREDETCMPGTREISVERVQD